MTAPRMTPGSAARITEQSKRDALRTLNRRASPLGLLGQWLQTFVIAVLLFFFVRAFFVEAFKIPSGSMERTLLPGDFLLVDKLAFGPEVPFTKLRLPGWRSPARGDVIVFQFPLDPTENYVKRLVGLPGDTLAMREGTLVRNGMPVSEPYVLHVDPGMDRFNEQFGWQRPYLVRTAEARFADHPSRNNWGPLVVPARSYFVLGDNRDNSNDSRYWGFVPMENVKGRPFVIYYSYAPSDSAGNFSFVSGIRWQRLGERIR